MGLSCSCDYDWDMDPGDWCYVNRKEMDFEPLQTSRRKRCCSCGDLIDIGALCIRHNRARYPYGDIESRIKTGMDLEGAFNDEPPIRMSDHYHCEACGEIYLNLTELGYECLVPNENMPGALEDYHELSGFKKGGNHVDK